MANYITAVFLDLATNVSLWDVLIRSSMILKPRPQFYSPPPSFLYVVLQPNAGNSSTVLRFLDQTWCTTLGRFLWMSDQLTAGTSDNTQHSWQTLMSLAGLESTISVCERLPTDAVEHKGTGIGFIKLMICINTKHQVHAIEYIVWWKLELPVAHTALQCCLPPCLVPSSRAPLGGKKGTRPQKFHCNLYHQQGAWDGWEM